MKMISKLAASAAGAGLVLGGVAMAAPAGAATPGAICTGACTWEQLAQPSGYDLNVKGQVAAAGTPIIAWKGQAGNPSFDFTVAKAAGTGSTSYTQNGSYQFASNTADYLTSGDYVITGAAQSHGDSSQALAADGVDLSATAAGSGYADSGVIVDLGKLSSMFGSSGYQAPVIKGSSDLAVNFYFGTNGTDKAYDTNSSDVYTGADGNNYASMGAASGGLGTADFTTFSGGAGSDTGFTQLSGQMTMANVQKAYADNAGTEGVKTADPEVWAWIGVVSTTKGQAVTGNVTSVDGTSLVTTTTKAGASGYQIKYTPYTNAAGAKAAGNTGAEAAYDSAGVPLYCVAVADAIRAQAHLAKCATAASASQDFLATPRVTGADHDLFELASDPSVALNDAQGGGNGSSIIAFTAGSSYWNEVFYPGAALAG